MTSFDDRETAFESKFAHDADMQFRAEARANKLLGLWAAELMGKTGAAASEYAMTVVSADFEEAGIEDVVRKVAADLTGKASADLPMKLRATDMPSATAGVVLLEIDTATATARRRASIRELSSAVMRMLPALAEVPEALRRRSCA